MSASGETFLDGRVALHRGDARDVLRGLPDASIDACVTDPPYALVSIGKRFGAEGAAPARSGGATGVYARASAGFMGQRWDTGETAFDPAFWREVWRVLKPGGHAVAFGGTRTYGHLQVALEAAGFEVRDSILDLVASDAHVGPFLACLDDAQRAAFARCLEESRFGGLLAWVFGSGFPKSHDVSKGIDRAAGATREKIATGAPVKRMIPGADQHRNGWEKTDGRDYVPGIELPATPEAAAWEGWGTALKPACEPIVLARKPLDGTVAENVLRHGTGAIHVDACRIESSAADQAAMARVVGFNRSYSNGEPSSVLEGGRDGSLRRRDRAEFDPSRGRWPANVVHDGSDEVLAAFPEAEGAYAPVRGSEPSAKTETVWGTMHRVPDARLPRGDSGSAARFFYSAKADADDRIGSKHPTVKPLALMRWLVRLVTPPGGTVLDPFAGTGTTGEAAFREGFSAVLVEREAPYCADIARRMALAAAGPATRRAESAKARGRQGAALPLFGAAEPAGGGAPSGRSELKK